MAWPTVPVSPYVGGVEILHVLRTGTFSQTVLARNPRGGGPERNEEVALKVATGSSRRPDILWEAALLRALATHAHIIKLLDVRASTPGGEDAPGDRPTLVFPPADVDLETFLDRRPRGVLPPALACRMMRQLASALAHVHSHGVIHRDVTPKNCLIFLAGEPAEVHKEFIEPALVLAEFGMARRAPGEPQRTFLDTLRRVPSMSPHVRTAWYRPPELWASTIMDERAVDADGREDDDGETTSHGLSHDKWSFGAVVYEALLGETLVRRAETGAAMARAVADVIGACPATEGPGALEYARDPRWRSWAADAKPAELPSRPPPEGPEWDLVRTCLQWDPSARGTMASALQCAWFARPEGLAAPEAASTSPTRSPTLGGESDRGHADASTLSDGAETSRERVLAWLQSPTDLGLLPPRVATTPASSETPCSCKGNCRVYKHRRDGKCDCTELVVGTPYCVSCKCVVKGCAKSRHGRGGMRDFCYGHGMVIRQAPFRVQLAAAAVPLASLMMPCDVVDFLCHSVVLQNDLPMLILTAAIKEPLPVGALVKAWKRLPAHYTGSHLRAALLGAVAAANGAPHGAQLEQLHRQGVCRFFGLIVTASNLGIIGKKADLKPTPRRRAAEAEGAVLPIARQEYRLGKNLTEYVELDPSACKCAEFLAAARAEEHVLATPPSDTAGASMPGALDDVVDFGTRRAEAALRRIGAKSGALPFSSEEAAGYCPDFLKRKLSAARLIQRNLHVECDWSTVDKASLQGMSADAKANLEAVPDDWRASDVSSFLTGRADWGLFASMYPCLWGEVADKRTSGGDQARALALVQSQDFRRVVLNFRRNFGIAPHPAVAFKILEAEEQGQAKRAEGTSRSGKRRAPKIPRASTPQSNSGKKPTSRSGKRRALGTPAGASSTSRSRRRRARGTPASASSTSRSGKRRAQETLRASMPQSNSGKALKRKAKT